jgi:ATP-dependent Clp protease ATP-binding subunit ClpA
MIVIIFNSMTPLAKKAMKLAQEEADILGDAYLGTEHILLGILRANNGSAARMLKSFGVNFEEIRKKILDGRPVVVDEDRDD